MNAGFPWLTALLFLPVAGAAIVLVVPDRSRVLLTAITIGVTAATGVIVAGLLAHLGSGVSSSAPITFHFEERHQWIPAVGASYHLGLDGMSGWLLALNAALFFVAAVMVAVRPPQRLKFMLGLLLLTETASAGVLLSVDLLLFYLFWESMLIPLYLILSNYGDGNRGPATLKFIVYTVAGSLVMLLSIIYMVVQSNTGSFDLQTLLLNPTLDRSHLLLPFIGFALAFLIKIPLVPFHTWLPDSYAAAPPAILVVFAGVIGKLGAYGLIRYGLTLFPGTVHDLQWVLTGIAILSIIYGALMALSSSDLKRIVAYASVSHLGFVCLGIFALNQNGLNGAIMQMVNHGIAIAALFIVVGIIEARTGTRDLRRLAGLERSMPVLYVLFLITSLATLGMPGTNTFVGEFTIMLGAFQASWILAVLASIGVVLASWYTLRLHQGVMHGSAAPAQVARTDIRLGEGVALVPLVALMLVLGFYPRPVGDVAQSSAAQYVTIAGGALARPPASVLVPPP